jgi:hypothetical protein
MRKLFPWMAVSILWWCAAVPVTAGCNEWIEVSRECQGPFCSYRIYYKLCKMTFGMDLCTDFCNPQDCCGSQVHGACVNLYGCELGSVRPLKRLDGASQEWLAHRMNCKAPAMLFKTAGFRSRSGER